MFQDVNKHNIVRMCSALTDQTKMKTFKNFYFQKFIQILTPAHMLTFSCHNITLPEIYQTQYMSAILIYLRIICNVAVLMYLKTKTVIHLTTIGSTQLKPQLSQLATSQ